jgi:cytochrome b6-f complex iron-sulfur subunit
MTDVSKVEPDKPETGTSRRRFLTILWFGLGGVALVECFWIIASFLKPRDGRLPGKDSDVVVAGAVEDFQSNSVTAFQKGKFYLVRLEDGGFLALNRVCTHLGCTVPWVEEERRFACPCHASAFDIRGDVLNPPAPRALDLFAVRIENGIVKVDTGKSIRRNSFEPSQVARL